MPSSLEEITDPLQQHTSKMKKSQKEKLINKTIINTELIKSPTTDEEEDMNSFIIS